MKAGLLRLCDSLVCDVPVLVMLLRDDVWARANDWTFIVDGKNILRIKSWKTLAKDLLTQILNTILYCMELCQCDKNVLVSLINYWSNFNPIVGVFIIFDQWRSSAFQLLTLFLHNELSIFLNNYMMKYSLRDNTNALIQVGIEKQYIYAGIFAVFELIIFKYYVLIK